MFLIDFSTQFWYSFSNVKIFSNTTMQVQNKYIEGIRKALEEERSALQSLPTSVVLTEGKRVVERKNRVHYKFEVPDNFYMAPGTTIRCHIGSVLTYEFPAIAVDVRGQLLDLLFPIDMGETIPEVRCLWNPAENIEQLLRKLSLLTSSSIVTQLLDKTFADNALSREREAIFPSTFSESQKNAIKESLARKISFVLGEQNLEKTEVTAAIIVNAVREKKRVLYISASSTALHECLRAITTMVGETAQQYIATVDSGLDVLPEISLPSYAPEVVINDSIKKGLQKLFSIIFAENVYRHIEELQRKITEKQKQIEEVTAEYNSAKEEYNKLERMSAIERMAKRVSKQDISLALMHKQHKYALMERLKQQIGALTKEKLKEEVRLPVPQKEKLAVAAYASHKVSFTNNEASKALHMQCLATTIHQVITLGLPTPTNYDVVIIDEAQAMSLPFFFFAASLAKSQLVVVANAAEQAPQSVSQVEAARDWLQCNYFAYLQGRHDEQRFTTAMLPADVRSEIIGQRTSPSLFTSMLFHLYGGTPIPSSARGKIYFIDTESQQAVSTQFIGKRKILLFNEVNARRVIECVKHALLNGATTQEDILIVTPPSGQSLYLRWQLKAHQCHNIEIATLGMLSRSRKRAVILDLTVAGIDFTLRALDDKKCGIKKLAENLYTVFATAQDELYIVADLGHFRQRYKGRFITQLLELMASKTDNVAAVSNAARRFDDLPLDLRTTVLFGSPKEKEMHDYKTKLTQLKPTVGDTGATAQQQTIASAEKKLTNNVYFAVLRVLSMREFINIIAQQLGTLPLYATTAETITFTSLLPNHDCSNENDFKIVMNMWNVLIYETSHARNVKHPLADKAKVESKISVEIQQIAQYYHSEIEMVVEEGKHRLAQSIQKIFNDCIGKKPATPTEWRSAYLVFLSRMEKYLDTVINQIRM